MVILLSDLARQDLEDIRTYTTEAWGRAQWLRYFRQISDAFESIALNPAIGRDRSLFVDNMRSLNCEHHVIFYKCLEASNRAPVILRIVHQKRYMPALIYYEDL